MTAGVVTGEAVRLDVRLAHWPSRLLAKLIDTAIQYVALFLLILTLGRIATGSDRALDTAIITAPEARDPELLSKLDAVAGRVLKTSGA